MAIKKNRIKAMAPKSWQIPSKPLPESLLKAAGMLRHHKKALERHLRQMRLEWDRRSSK